MAALSAFVPLVAPFVPGAAPIAIQAAVLQAAIEFCEKTLTLQRTLASVPTVIDQGAYTLTQSGEVVAKLLGAKLDGVPLGLLTPADLDDEDTPTESVAAPCDIVLTGPMQVTLTPPPSVAGLALVVRAAMRPSQTATTVADELHERHAAAIAAGAAAWLLNQPGTAYRDADRSGKTALERAGAFEAAIGAERARIFRNRSRARGRPAVQWV